MVKKLWGLSKDWDHSDSKVIDCNACLWEHSQEKILSHSDAASRWFILIIVRTIEKELTGNKHIIQEPHADSSHFHVRVKALEKSLLGIRSKYLWPFNREIWPS